MNLTKSVMGAVLVIGFALPGFAQEDFFRNGIQLGIGARAIGMGGAYGAVGDDYSASFWNPAALAQIRRFEVAGGLNHLMRENNAAFSGLTTNDEVSLTNLQEIGFAYPVPTYRGSMVFSFGYNRIKSFDANFAFSAFNPLPDDSVSQSWKERENGNLNNWTVAAAVDLSPQFSGGIGLNFWTGDDEYQFTMRENDNLDIYTFRDYRNDDVINSSYSGFNLTFGGLFRVNNHMRLFGTLSTPVTITIKEDWKTSDETTFDDAVPEFSNDNGNTEYKLRSPFTFTGGGSINLAGLLVSGQAEFNDWSQIRYRTDPPIADKTQAEANDEIDSNYRATTRLRLGAELTLPGSATQLRAGYYLDPSPFKNVGSEADKKFYSVGLGLLLDKQIKLDVAYVYGTWKEANAGLNNYVTSLDEEIKVRKIFTTLSFRL